MKLTIHPEALRLARDKKGWTQKELSAESNISIEQISRWERSVTNGNLRASSRDRLTAALNVRWEELSTPPLAQESKASHKVPVSFRVDLGFKNKLKLASRRYNVSQADIIELAPLLFLIAAEGSLAARKNQVDDIEKQFEEILGNSQKYAPLLSATLYNESEFKKATEFERVLIRNKKIWGLENYFQPDFHRALYSGVLDIFENDSFEPFYNFLENSIKEFPLDIPDEELPKEAKGPDYCYANQSEYRIAANTLKEITGITGKLEFDCEVFDWISAGYIDLNELIKVKQNSSSDDFDDWLQKKHEEVKVVLDSEKIEFDC
jgi:transcriptional regulator with XRE-family HTH domain